VALAGAVTTVGDAPDYKKLYEEQKARTDALEKRLAILEEKVAGEYVPKSDVTETTLGFLGKTEISGYVAGSYFFNFNEPSSHENTGRGFDVRHNEFMLNKAVLKLEKPTEFNAFDWTVGYGVELLFGQDAEFTQASGLGLGDQGDLLQAYVEFNVPVGNGLKVLLGKCSTEMGFELTETEQNYNWSAGNQWTFLEPFTHTGIRLTYALSDQWEAALLFNNGWDNVRDNNNSQSWMGRLRYSPNDNTSYTFIGFGGPEQGANNHDWRRGVDIVIDHKWNHIWHSALQLDYGAEDGADASGGVAEWWGVGLWMVYEPSEKWNVAFRGDWVNDIDGARTSETPYLAPFPPNDGQELISLTLTVNFKPVEELRIAPELRWDHSTLDEAFGGHSDQVTIGVGAAYFF
jgi:hypothetical protein